MAWVLLFAAIAVSGLIMVAGYAIWLAHLAADVYSEVAVLAHRAGELAELAGQIGSRHPAGGPDPSRDVGTADDDELLTSLDVR